MWASPSLLIHDMIAKVKCPDVVSLVSIQLGELRVKLDREYPEVLAVVHESICDGSRAAEEIPNDQRRSIN